MTPFPLTNNTLRRSHGIAVQRRGIIIVFPDMNTPPGEHTDEEGMIRIRAGERVEQRHVDAELEVEIWLDAVCVFRLLFDGHGERLDRWGVQG